MVHERLPFTHEEWEAAIALGKSSNVKGRDETRKTHNTVAVLHENAVSHLPHESVRCSLQEEDRQD